jgi:hypothetical protein
MKTLSICVLFAVSLTALTGCESEPAAVAKTSSDDLRQVSATEPVASPSTDPPADEPTQKVAPATTEGETPKPIYVRPRTRIRSGGVMDIDFDYLAFDIEADADFEEKMFTDQINELNGKEIILRGFILDASVFSQKGIKEFVLIRDNQECCFGPGAKICHNVWVNMDEGKTAKFSFRPVEVHGKFTIKLYHGPVDGKVYSVYHLQAKNVKPAG